MSNATGNSNTNTAQKTRVESLFLLVRDGSSAEIRENAAEKLGEVALQSTESCQAIITQVRALMMDNAWEIRVAASKCLAVVARSLRHEGALLAEQFATTSLGGRSSSHCLNFQTVNIRQVVHEGESLLRSGGEEYQYQTNLTPEERRVQAIKQRRLLLQRICGSSDQLWKTKEDSLAKQMLPQLNLDHVKDIAEDIEQSEKTVGLPSNKADEKRKQTAGEILNITARTNASAATSGSARGTKRRKLELMEEASSSGSLPIVNEYWSSDSDGNDTQTCLGIVADLLADLFECIFDSKWEVRHGALLAIRQIFLSSRLIETLETCKAAKEEHVERWIEECIVRCICVLALDRFVDYSADGSVSPVREVCAQVFGILLGNLASEGLLIKYLRVLRSLLEGATWHACHGGLLGLKYLIQAHKVHAKSLIPLIFDDVTHAFALESAEEEVLVLTATMLEDFTDHIDDVDANKLQLACQLLWDALAYKRSNGMVPASSIQALSAWYNHSPLRTIIEANKEVSSRRWTNLPYMISLLHQHAKSVRLASSACIIAMFPSGTTSSVAAELPFLNCLLPHLLLQLLREEDENIREKLLIAWKCVVETCARSSSLVQLVSGKLSQWMELLWSTRDPHHLNVSVRGESANSDANETDAWIDMVVLAANTWENTASRVAYADALGFLAAALPLFSSSINVITEIISSEMHSTSGERQCGVLLMVSRWAFYEKQHFNFSSDGELIRLHHLLGTIGVELDSYASNGWVVKPNEGEEPTIYYAEQKGPLHRVQKMHQRIVDLFSTVGLQVKPVSSSGFLSAADISREIAEHVSTFPYEQLRNHATEYELAHFKRQDLFLVDESIQQNFSLFYHRAQGLGSCAFCSLLAIPKKSGFLVKALMDSIKREENPDFQRLFAQTLSDFVVSQAEVQRKCVSKIISNLCSSATALVQVPGFLEQSVSIDALKCAQIRVDGAENVLKTIVKIPGIFELCPILEETICKAWKETVAEERVVQQSMHLVDLLTPYVHESALQKCLSWLEGTTGLIGRYVESKVRRAIANTIASICKHAKSHQEQAMLIVYQTVFASFMESEGVHKDQLLGAVTVLDCMVASMQGALTPYVPSLVHFAMMIMNSQYEEVRTLAARAFADLVPLIPLQMDLQSAMTYQTQPNGIMSDALGAIVNQNQVSRTFLENLLNGKGVQHSDVSALLADGISLRLYQQHGVDWLSFLVKNQLHGILADDMGLGKTLQTLAAMAKALSIKQSSKHTEQKRDQPQLCLIVCPPIIVDHWITEAEKCLHHAFDEIVDYSASTAVRKTLRNQGKLSALSSSRQEYWSVLVVTTYSVLRADIQYLNAIEFLFVVLDEAHLIRNPTTQLFQAIKQLRAAHRLALSGTPLQNNVADLWSLFEFLMPGYLGDFPAFRRDFVTPISASKEQNATTKQKEIAALAITRLHQKVLPFILRRTKEQVLKELPPKIITNILGTFSPLQKRLYALATTAPTNGNVLHGKDQQFSSVLTNLQILRKICVHPALVAKEPIMDRLPSKEKKDLWDWRSSGKMTLLRDLLVDSCNIASYGQENAQANEDEVPLSQHRCLIFAHLKETLDLTELMLKDALPRVMFRRLDGRTTQGRRSQIVKMFNEDPSIDILLLTTAAGGLGLTLTGADTVIFLEHSWNPFVDLQAMDRVHRIGQKRTVRVFRLIMKESLEEHIMNLQLFKERVATTVVSVSGAESSMNVNTKQVLSLLQESSATIKARDVAAALKESKHDDGKVPSEVAFLPRAATELLGQLGELWDESEYNSLAFPAVQEQ